MAGEFDDIRARLETISDLKKVERAFQPGFGPAFASGPPRG